MACVYRHIRPDTNEVFYIGIGINIKRAYSKQRRNQHWKNVIILNPNYKIEILFDNVDYVFACQKEIEFIKLYGRKDLNLGTLVNKCDGGRTNKGATRKDLIIYNQTRINPNKGVIRSQEYKENMRQSTLGKKSYEGDNWLLIDINNNQFEIENLVKYCKDNNYKLYKVKYLKNTYRVTGKFTATKIIKQ